MSVAEILESAAPAIGSGALGTAIGALAMAWAKARKAASEASASVAVAREQGAAAMGDQLMEMLKSAMKDIRSEREAHEAKVAAMEEDCDRKRAADKEQCHEEIRGVRAEVYGELERLGVRVATDLARRGDDTGRIEIEGVVRRARTRRSHGEIPVYRPADDTPPEPIRALRPPPPLPRRQPPDEGEER